MNRLEEIINKCREVHGDKYDYSLIKEIINKKDKQPIICPVHGVFYKSIEKHINEKQGYPYCSGKYRYSTETFIENIIVHPQ